MEGKKGGEEEMGAGQELHGYNQREEGLEQEQRQAGGCMKQHIAFSLGQNTLLAPSPQRGLKNPGKAGRKQGCLS